MNQPKPKKQRPTIKNKKNKPAFMLRDTPDFSLTRQDKVAFAQRPATDGFGIFLGMLLVYVCTLSFLFIFSSAIHTQPDVLPVLLFSAVTTLLWCSFRAQSSMVNLLSIFGILFLAVALLWNHEKIADGFFYCVQDFYDKINVSDSTIEQRVDQADYGYSSAVTWLFCTAALLVSGGAALGSFLTGQFLILFIFTFPLLEIPLYWGLVPDYAAFFFGILCWVAALLSSTVSFRYNKPVSRRTKKFVLPDPPHASLIVKKQLTLVSVAITTAVVFLSFLINTIFPYERPESFDTTRRNVNVAMNRITDGDLFGGFEQLNSSFSSLFPFGSSGNYNRGSLGNKSSIRYNGKTALKVSTSQTIDRDFYLKSYTASEYTGHSWKLPDESTQDAYTAQLQEIFGTKLPAQTVIDALPYTSLPISYYQFNIENVNAGKETYLPYLSDLMGENTAATNTMDYFRSLNKTNYSVQCYALTNEDLALFSEEFNAMNLYTEETQDLSVYDDDDTISQTYTKFRLYDEYAYQNFRDVTQTDAIEQVISDLQSTVNQLSEEYQISTYSNSETNTNQYRLAIAQVLADYFDTNFTYSLSPGKTPSDEDFVDYFLTEQKQGYCTYFASAGVLIMRALGIPARYAEGFVLSTDDAHEVNESGSYTYKVTDKSAHAWTEIYLDGVGWVPVEFTPGYSSGYNPNNTATAQNTTTTTPTTTTALTTTDQGATKTTTQSGAVSKGADNTTTSAVATAQSKDSTLFLYLIIPAILILLLLFGLLVRKIRLWLIQHSLRIENPIPSVKNAHHLALRYLAAAGFVPDEQNTDLQNAQALAARFFAETGTDISAEMKQITQLALQAELSATAPQAEDARMACNALKIIADAVYQSLSRTGKWIAKYIYALYE